MHASDRAGLPELRFDAAYFTDPHGTLGPLLRAGASAVRVRELGTCMFLRNADVLAALQDRRFGAMGVRYYEDQGWHSGPYIEWVRRTVVFLDPPDHDRLRALLSRAFSPRQVARVRGLTEAIAEQLADAAADAREVDLYDAYAQRLPLRVICDLLAIPGVDCATIGAWTAALSLATAAPDAAARAGADAAMRSFDDYVGALIVERRVRPGDDLLSALIAAEEGGDRLSRDELVAMVVQLLYAGHETTRNLIGNGLYTLMQHPEQLALLRREPARMPGAVEEILRYEPPIIFLSRIVREDLELAGQELCKDEMIHVSLSAANRDPAQCADPDRFDVTRTPGRHLSFGWGMHFCTGAAIARMEGRVALDTLLRRFAKLEFDGNPPPWAPATALRSLEHFPLRLTPA